MVQTITEKKYFLPCLKIILKIKVLWQNKIVSNLNDIKMKKIPGWKERYSVEKSFYKDLNANN